jgi:hypothetical protein
MTKAEKARIRAEFQAIRVAVQELPRGAALDFTTALSAKQIAPELYGIEDTAGYTKGYKCQKIGGGVRVTCTGAFKITAAYSTTGT